MLVLHYTVFFHVIGGLMRHYEYLCSIRKGIMTGFIEQIGLCFDTRPCSSTTTTTSRSAKGALVSDTKGLEFVG